MKCYTILYNMQYYKIPTIFSNSRLPPMQCSTFDCSARSSGVKSKSNGTTLQTLHLTMFQLSWVSVWALAFLWCNSKYLESTFTSKNVSTLLGGVSLSCCFSPGCSVSVALLLCCRQIPRELSINLPTKNLHVLHRMTLYPKKPKITLLDMLREVISYQKRFF